MTSNACHTSGQERAQIDALYRKHFRPLVARLRRLHGSGPPDADDLAQIAFAKLAEMEDLGRIREPGAFLFRIAVNAGLDQLDRLDSSRRYVRDELNRRSIVQNTTPETVYLAREDLNRLRDLIAKLPAPEREIILRSRFKGETLTAIAADLGMNVSSVSRQLARTLQRLQTALKAGDARGEDNKA